MEQNSLASPPAEPGQDSTLRKAFSQCLIHQNIEQNSNEEKSVVRINQQKFIASFSRELEPYKKATQQQALSTTAHCQRTINYYLLSKHTIYYSMYYHVMLI